MSDDIDWRKRLLDRRAELESSLATASDASAPVELDQSRVGRLSRMDALQGQAMSKAADRRRQLELQQIQAALLRIDDGSFGECLKCAELIESGRLEFAPPNPLCLACAEQLEA